MSAPVNNGEKIFTLLAEYNARTGEPTGRTKPNVPADPNYIAPTTDLVACPLPGDPVIPTIDVTVVIGPEFAATFNLLFGIDHVETSVAGIWTITDRVYDGIIFEVTTAPEAYTLRIDYASGVSYKQTNNAGVVNTFIPGPFDQITQVSIVSNVGDFNNDWNPDYLI